MLGRDSIGILPRRVVELDNDFPFLWIQRYILPAGSAMQGVSGEPVNRTE